MEHIANKSQFETIIKLIRGTYYWGEWTMENDQFHLVKMSSEQLDCQGSKLIVLMEESLKNLIGVIKIDPNICYEDNSKFVDKCMQVCDHYELIIEMHQDTGSTLFNSDETVRNPTLLSAIERRETVQPIEQQIGQIDKEEFYMSLVDRTMSVEQKLEQKLNQNSEMDRLKKLFNQKATIAEKMDIVRMLKKADWTLEDMVYVDLKPRLGNNIFDKLWYVWRFESDETFRRKLIDLSTDYIISVDLLKIIAPMYNEQLYDDVNFWLDKLSSETNSSKIVDEIRALRREKREEKQKNEKKPKKEKRNKMPTVGIKKLLLDKHFNRIYSEKEFDELCFEYGLELDEITSEKAAVEKERGTNAATDLNDQEVYKIDIPANRYDLLSVEGLSRAIRIFKQEIPPPKYTFAPIPKSGLQKIIVKKETATIRSFVVGAVLRNIQFDADNFASFIDLQDKLHQNICRKRTLVAIGTHDLDTIQGPFEYRAEAPKDIKFRPLNQTKGYTAEELMTLYSSDSHLKAYLPIIQNHPKYPVIYDSKGIVCSMPPIINGEHSKITLNTKNVLIEATATDKQKAFVVLDTIVTLFSQYCAKPFEVEQVEVVYEESGEKELYPQNLLESEFQGQFSSKTTPEA
ncbi:unnamed protein product [Caenorhabditis angaria]|uniref:phenylalanine--tRNA ligase n=1 Tax=Caenorhabditis angaria TaxID=860376 RepID=A0A9P1IDT7_9PELO|nr:unnamed protein product [Caenorhabditis angaria]